MCKCENLAPIRSVTKQCCGNDIAPGRKEKLIPPIITGDDGPDKLFVFVFQRENTNQNPTKAFVRN